MLYIRLIKIHIGFFFVLFCFVLHYIVLCTCISRRLRDTYIKKQAHFSFSYFDIWLNGRIIKREQYICVFFLMKSGNSLHRSEIITTPEVISGKVTIENQFRWLIVFDNCNKVYQNKLYRELVKPRKTVSVVSLIKEFHYRAFTHCD